MANEDALRDGNRTATLLYDQNGETRRVSPANPLPVLEDPLLKTASVEITGTQTQTIVTPGAGKRLIVKGAAIISESAMAGDAQIRFAGGKLVHKVYRGDQSGFVPLRTEGVVDEVLQVQTIGFAVAQRAFFIVNYEEA